ncbi:hypothetical protein KM043_017055 [Ampulex compressa]|nr:hypothetical protein KM043_017055 [Ampulex compressa]
MRGSSWRLGRLNSRCWSFEVWTSKLVAFLWKTSAKSDNRILLPDRKTFTSKRVLGGRGRYRRLEEIDRFVSSLFPSVSSSPDIASRPLISRL